LTTSKNNRVKLYVNFNILFKEAIMNLIKLLIASFFFTTSTFSHAQLAPKGSNTNERYGYLTSSNICAILDTTASTPTWQRPLDIDRYFGDSLQLLLSVKEVPVDIVISNITSSIDWIERYNLQNLRIKIRDGYTLEQFSRDLPRMISWFNNKNSGASCPWGMPFDEVAWGVYYVFGTYSTCNSAARFSGGSTESVMAQIRHCEKYRGRENNNSHMGILHGAGNIDQYYVSEKQKQENQVKTRQIHQDFDAKKRNQRIDLISQVLNFSIGKPDNGSNRGFWERSQEEQCIYLLHSRDSHNPILSININELDPNSIRFDYQLDALGSFRTVIYANDNVLLYASKQLDINRLHNGWRKVFQSNCKGKKRAF